MKSARVPLLRGSHVSPPSAEWNTPADEMPTQSFLESDGCCTIACRISPAPPGCQFGRVG
jgi:hypothetical protein